MTEKEKYLEWFTKQKDKGLLNIRFTINPNAKGRTEEELYGELNRLNEAPDLPDEEVLGKYSPLI